MEEKFTIEEFKNYLLSQDSLGDIMYNLSVKNIRKANEEDETEPSVEKCEHYCNDVCNSLETELHYCNGVCNHYHEIK